MKQKSIYWSKPDLFCLQTNIEDVRSNPDEKAKNSWGIVLETTPFYPGGGGQPADKGTISGCYINSVDNSGPSPLYFITTVSPPNKGDSVECVVDEEHRWDYRQQHTGQHLISAILARKGINTLSVHMGRMYLGIEVESKPDNKLIMEVSQICNELISRNLKVESNTYTHAELEKVELRSPIKVKQSSSIRVVSIEGVDCVGCGGIHVCSTSALKLILFVGSEKVHAGVRLKWLVGERALNQVQAINTRHSQIQKILKTNSENLIPEVEKLLSRNDELMRIIKANQAQMVKILADKVITNQSAAEHLIGDRKLAVSLINNLKKSGVRIFFLLLEDNKTRKLYWFLLDNRNCSDCYIDVFKNILSDYQFRGGGKKPYWQGTISGNVQDILSQVIQMIH